MNSSELKYIVSSLVAKHINDPTHEMRIAFRKLSAAHKWLLFTILESGDRPSFLSEKNDMQKMETRFNTLCPENTHRPFNLIIEELSEGFIQLIRHQENIIGVTWIHPSCQDLTIEELAASSEDRNRFLNLCSREGLEKAMAVAGGADGSRVMPLFVTDTDWVTLHTRCVYFFETRNDVSSLLTSSYSSLNLLKERRQEKLVRLTETISKLWSPYFKLIKKQLPSSVSVLSVFYKMRLISKAKNSFPKLSQLWSDIVRDIIDAMQDDLVIEEHTYLLERFGKISRIFITHEHAFWLKSLTQELFEEALSSISDRVREEIDTHYSHDSNDYKSLEQTAKEYTELAEQLGILASLPNLDRDICDTLIEGQSHFIHQSESIQEKADEKRPSEIVSRGVWDTAAEIEGREVTLAKLFEDL